MDEFLNLIKNNIDTVDVALLMILRIFMLLDRTGDLSIKVRAFFVKVKKILTKKK